MEIKLDILHLGTMMMTFPSNKEGDNFMTIEDASVLVHHGYITPDQSDFENAKALGIDFNCATWSTSFIVKCISYGKGLIHALLVIDFLRGAKLGAHGIMTYKRAEWLKGFAVALSQVKLGDINLDEIKSNRRG